MDADRSSARGGLLAGELTGQVIGAFYAVYNELGFGHAEVVYRSALQVELTLLRLAWQRELPLPVVYKGVQVGLGRCDLLIERRLIVEVKATHAITNGDHRQLLGYLRAADVEVGLLLHFGPKPAHHRVVATRSHFATRSDPRDPRDPR